MAVIIRNASIQMTSPAHQRQIHKELLLNNPKMENLRATVERFICLDSIESWHAYMEVQILYFDQQQALLIEVYISA